MQDGRYALIYENEIKNIFICENYELANVLARASFGDNAFSIEVSRYIVGIGDKYENGIFYHTLDNGDIKEAEYIPTNDEEIKQLKYQIEKINETIKGLEDKIKSILKEE